MSSGVTHACHTAGRGALTAVFIDMLIAVLLVLKRSLGQRFSRAAIVKQDIAWLLRRKMRLHKGAGGMEIAPFSSAFQVFDQELGQGHLQLVGILERIPDGVLTEHRIATFFCSSRKGLFIVSV